ncbi:MAG: peroxiredoxin [Synechococcus sp.]
MNRRDLLLRCLGFGVLFCCPNPSRALGGEAPPLNKHAPDFKLAGTRRQDDAVQQWSLNNFSGRWLVLYFYPRDFTSGCTIEAHGFQSLNQDFEQHNASIVGISADGVDDHASFCSSESLDYLLLSDPDGTVSKAYGSWMAPYSMRHTFLIDPSGVIRERWTGVRPSGHAKEVMERLLQLQGEASI